MSANLGSAIAGVLFSCSLWKWVQILVPLRLMYFFPALCQNSKWGKSWLFYGWRTFFLLSFKIGAYIGFTKAGVFFSCSLSKLVQILAPLRLVYFFLLSVKMRQILALLKKVYFFSCSLSKWVEILALLKLVYIFPALCQNGCKSKLH